MYVECDVPDGFVHVAQVTSLTVARLGTTHLFFLVHPPHTPRLTSYAFLLEVITAAAAHVDLPCISTVPVSYVFSLPPSLSPFPP